MPGYALDGRFVNSCVRGAGFDKASICLTPVKIDIMHGFIFANLDPEARPMDEWFPGVREELGAHVPDIDRLETTEWWRYLKTATEGFGRKLLECYTAPDPQDLSTGVIKPETYDIQPQGYCLRHTTECQQLDAMTYPVDLDANDYAGVYSSWFLWPVFSFQVYPGNVLNTYHWRAHDADHVTVWRGWYTIDGADSDIMRQLAVQDRETTVAEDITLVGSVQKGLSSRGYVPGRYCRSGLRC